MTTSYKKQRAAQVGAMALLSSWASAAIAENGIWTNNDWYDETLKIGVANGEPYSNDASMRHRLNAPLSVDGDVSQDYMTRANVIRIVSIFDENDW